MNGIFLNNTERNYITDTIITFIQNIEKNNWNHLLATPKEIKEHLDETTLFNFSLKEIETICYNLIEFQKLTSYTITYNTKEYILLCTIEYKNELNRHNKEINELSKEELEIIDMLRHYFLYKGCFSQNLFEECMIYLIQRKNPFLYLKDQFEKQASKANYSPLNSPVFTYKLKGDK